MEESERYRWLGPKRYDIVSPAGGWYSVVAACGRNAWPVLSGKRAGCGCGQWGGQGRGCTLGQQHQQPRLSLSVAWEP